MQSNVILLIVASILFATEIGYFRLANKFNIIDKPNERSLHSEITIRGGGIIFVIAALIYFIDSGFQYPLFFLGLTIVSTVSFLDDIFTLSNRYRLLFQFLSVGLILLDLPFPLSSLLLIVVALILGVGIINAYNFMDGINGITGGYSTVVIIALWFVNNFHVKFIDNDFLIFIFLGLMVFNFFNFRVKAKCFAGDVGSISMAIIILFLLLKLILEDRNLIYILFLGVYGVDSILTIIHRIVLKQNIFKAHRLHLFQVIVHYKKIPHLIMSSVYMIIQAVICSIIIINLRQNFTFQLLVGGSIIIILVLIYVVIKKQIMKQIIPLNN